MLVYGNVSKTPAPTHCAVFLGTSLNIKDGYSAAKPKRVPINQKMVECMSSFFYCFLDASKFSYRNDFFSLHK